MRAFVVSLGLLLVVTPAFGKLRPVKLNVVSGKVAKGSEKQTCFPIVFPRDQAMDVDQVQIRVRGGSHHVHLYRPVSGTVMYPNPDNTYSPAGPGNRRPRECAFAIDFSHWQLVAASQTSSLNWALHPGVGIHFEPRQALMIQTHFVNTGFGGVNLKVKGRARAKMLLYPMAAGTLSMNAGALFGQDRTVKVPPGISSGRSNCAMTGAVADAKPMTIMALTGHYHFRGVGYRIWRKLADGTRGELIYLQEGYEDPKFQQYAPGELVLQPGEGIEWECTWQNNSDQTFLFGPDTGKNEHCNLFGFYYPTTSPLESMDCVHKEDGSEIVTIRH